MLTFKEFIISFLESSRDRLKNPAVGSFTLSWLAINWRIVSILFYSNSTIEEKIRIIEECYLALPLNLWYPLAITGVYLLILPNFMAVVDALTRWSINLRIQIANRHKLNSILLKQEIAVEERQLELVEEGSPDIAELKRQIAELQARQPVNVNIENNTKNTTEIIDEQEARSSNPEPSTKAPKKRTSSRKLKSTGTKDEKNVEPLPTSKSYPAMRENVVKNVAKSEKEWILLYGFYAGDFGKKEFTRENILSAYEETKRKTKSRHLNMSNNTNTLVKQGFIRYLNDNEMLLTDAGIELAKEILNRTK